MINTQTSHFPLSEIEKKINIHFKDKKILENAFVHRSYLNEHPDFELNSNEKLEFLGDSVLSLITSHYLYTHYPEYSEGEYTDIKASIVNTQSLYQAAKEIQLGEYIYLSKGEQEHNGRDNISILADCFEALLGVIYLEKGYEVSTKFVVDFLFKDVLDTIVSQKLYLPSKNILQEYYQNKRKNIPEYKVLREIGPEHSKVYEIGVYDGKKLLGSGQGKSKKHAEEAAARDALQSIGI